MSSLTERCTRAYTEPRSSAIDSRFTPGGLMRGLLLVLLAATGGSVHGVPDSTRAMRVEGSPAAATLIDFETYPNGTPTCNLCPITNDYSSQGLEISWASQRFPGTSATLANGVGSMYGDAANTRNHFVMWSVNHHNGRKRRTGLPPPARSRPGRRFFRAAVVPLICATPARVGHEFGRRGDRPGALPT